MLPVAVTAQIKQVENMNAANGNDSTNQAYKKHECCKQQWHDTPLSWNKIPYHHCSPHRCHTTQEEPGNRVSASPVFVITAAASAPLPHHRNGLVALWRFMILKRFGWKLLFPSWFGSQSVWSELLMPCQCIFSVSHSTHLHRQKLALN